MNTEIEIEKNAIHLCIKISCTKNDFYKVIKHIQTLGYTKTKKFINKYNDKRIKTNDIIYFSFGIDRNEKTINTQEVIFCKKYSNPLNIHNYTFIEMIDIENVYTKLNYLCGTKQ